MIEIARFADVYEAEIAAARLRAERYDPVLGGAEHVKTNALVLQALGGVNLSVPAGQSDAARLLLDRLRAGAERIEDGEPAARSTLKLHPLVLLAAIGLGIAVTLAVRVPSPPPSWGPPLW